MTVIFSKALKNSGTWTAKMSDSLVQIFDKYHDFHTNPSRKSSVNSSCSLAVGIQRSLSTDAPPTAMTLFAFNRILIPLVALFIDFHVDKIPNEAASRQFRCGLWRVFIVDFGAIPLWTLKNPSFHALDAAEIHPYETAAWPYGPKALKAAKRRFNHLKAEGRLNLALPYLYQTFQRKRPRPGAVSTRAVRGAAAVRSSVTAAGFSLPLPTLRRKPTIERTCL